MPRYKTSAGVEHYGGRGSFAPGPPLTRGVPSGGLSEGVAGSRGINTSDEGLERETGQQPNDIVTPMRTDLSEPVELERNIPTNHAIVPYSWGSDQSGEQEMKTGFGDRPGVKRVEIVDTAFLGCRSHGT